jgi:hypothetical protein
MAPATLDSPRQFDHPEVRSHLLVVLAMIMVAIASLSCSALQPSTARSSASAPVFETSGSVVRVPLSPPAGYQPPTQVSTASASSASFEGSFNHGRETGAVGKWRASPRWAAIRGNGCVVVEQDRQTDSAVGTNSAKFRVERCSKENGDDQAQLKENPNVP